MTEQTRLVTGLVRANREQPSPSPAREPAVQAATLAPARPKASAPRKPRPRPQAAPASAAPASAKVQVTVNIPIEIRDESRSAFVAARNGEDYSSYSDFVARAVREATERLRDKYNGGEPFAGGERPLPPGRPLQS